MAKQVGIQEGGGGGGRGSGNRSRCKTGPHAGLDGCRASGGLLKRWHSGGHVQSHTHTLFVRQVFMQPTDLSASAWLRTRPWTLQGLLSQWKQPHRTCSLISFWGRQKLNLCTRLVHSSLSCWQSTCHEACIRICGSSLKLKAETHLFA